MLLHFRIASVPICLIVQSNHYLLGSLLSLVVVVVVVVVLVVVVVVAVAVAVAVAIAIAVAVEVSGFPPVSLVALYVIFWVLLALSYFGAVLQQFPAASAGGVFPRLFSSCRVFNTAMIISTCFGNWKSAA